LAVELSGDPWIQVRKHRKVNQSQPRIDDEGRLRPSYVSPKIAATILPALTPT
jgi:hypothetical protein